MEKLPDLKKSLIQPLVNNIIKELKLKSNLDISLLGGDFGSVMSLYYASKHGYCKQEQADELLDRVLQNLNVMSNPQATYCNGLTGLSIGLCMLEKDGFIEGAYNSTNRYHNLLSRLLYKYLPNNLDFLHGSIGISMYFLTHRNNANSAEVIEKVVRYLYDNAIPSENGGSYWKFPNKDGELVENLSLSHGISAVTLFLSRALSIIEKPEIKRMGIELLKNIGIYIKSYLVSPEEGGFYTPMIPYGRKSRLGWCYGDVGTSMALRAISELTCDNELAELAYKIARYSALYRKDLNSNSIYDACLCHGASGLIVFFNNCYCYYKEDLFSDAAQYWTKITVSMAKPYRGETRFDHYFPSYSTRLHSTNILEGDSGVLLALLNEKDLLNNILFLDYEI